MIRGLAPDDPPEWLRDEVGALEHDVLLVGHMPHLPRLARLLNGDAVLRPHSFVEFERTADGRWRVVSESTDPARS
jgi:phosphohistidine phosphatase SixA